MTTIQTSAHIGADGMLRLEIPVAEKDQEVRVLLIVNGESAGEVAGPAFTDLPAIRFPKAGSWNSSPVEPLQIRTPGPSASEMLVSDRR